MIIMSSQFPTFMDLFVNRLQNTMLALFLAITGWVAYVFILNLAELFRDTAKEYGISLRTLLRITYAMAIHELLLEPLDKITDKLDYNFLIRLRYNLALYLLRYDEHTDVLMEQVKSKAA